MARPSRLATSKTSSFAEPEESDDSAHNISDDDSFDEDDDPDKIEVPGGGSSLEDVKNITQTKTMDAEFPVASSSSQVDPTRGGPDLNALYNPGRQNQNFGGLFNDFSDLLKFSTSFPLMSGMNPMAGNPMENMQRILDRFPSNPAYPSWNMDHNAMLGMLLGVPYMNVNGNPVFQDPMTDILDPTQGAYIRKYQRQVQPEPQTTEDQENEDDEALGLAETYSDYIPSKLKFGKCHPDPIVETASLASVEPPDVYYKLSLPDKVTEKGKLSALQLEAVVYACQQHEHFFENGERAGYLIGDGAGVGKGRTIAGVIYENWLKGRKRSLWVSVSADLKEDAERDLRDIGAKAICVTFLSKLKYGKIKDIPDGVLFSTYSGLIGESSTTGKFNSRLKQIMDWLGNNFEGVIVFDECHRAKNLCPVGSTKPTKTGVTVHRLQKELKRARVVYASATGASEPKNMAYMTRLGIWGPGTPFNDFQEFIQAVEKRGVGAMEIVAMDMKLRGAYIARQLSFKGVGFTIEEVPLSETFQKLYNDCVDLWVNAMNRFIEAAELMKIDNMVKKTMWAQFWASHQRFFKYLCIAGKVDRAVVIAREAVKNGKCVVIGLQSTGEARTAEQVEREGELDDFVSTAKGVFQSLVEKHFPAPDRSKTNKIMSLLGYSTLNLDKEPQPSTASGKGKPMRKAAQNAAKRARWNDSDASGQDNDSDFSAPGVSGSDTEVSTDSKASVSDFESVSSDAESDDQKRGGMKRKRGPKKSNAKKQKATQDPANAPGYAAMERAREIKAALLEKIEELGPRMPSNTLDQLIDELGGPTDVAEMTGRKMRLIQVDSGKIEYQSRAENDVTLEQINLIEKQRFMDGEKFIAIISEAASSGISLQSDRRVKNHRRRVHITLELPWSADRAIQQFGRTHRSNQVNAPEYVFLISDLAGEHRFASIVAKRLESLGALTHGDRRATESRDLSRFHIDNKYGKQALDIIMGYILRGSSSSLCAVPKDYTGDFRSDMAAGLVGVGLIVNSEEGFPHVVPEKDFNNMSKFLNRILGMHVELQNAIFKFFSDTLTAVILNAKKTGRFDMGILNLGDADGDRTEIEHTDQYSRKHATGYGKIELHRVVVERGITWEEAALKRELLTEEEEGFYISKELRNNVKLAILVQLEVGNRDTNKNKKKSDKRFVSVYRPNIGLQLRRESIDDLKLKYSKCDDKTAEKYWKEQFDAAATCCTHAFMSNNSICKNGAVCDIGKRRRTHYVLSGSVLLCWDDIESTVSTRINAKIQIVRVQSSCGKKFVGILVPYQVIDHLKLKLEGKSQDEIKKELLDGAA